MGKLIHWFKEQSAVKLGVAFLLLFIAWYPKLPSVGIPHTWVYIRLEDFFILLVTFVWFIQLVRRKATLALPLSLPIFLYWVCGLVTLIYSLIFVGPYIANFFPLVAILNYARRIEYMILFFVALSTIKSWRDIRDYAIILSIAAFGVIVYGLGQNTYLFFWAKFPDFFKQYSFCFPSFQTGNEEFAKGTPLCLPAGARITSTFGGHYDLAGYMVLLIPLFASFFFHLKHKGRRVFFALLATLSLMMLILTASRISFIAYIIGIVSLLIFAHKKKFILPVLVFSIILLMLFSGSTAKRFLQTIRFTSIVTDNTGQVVGEASLPDDLQKKVAKGELILEDAPPTQNLPTGTQFTTLQGIKAPTATTSAIVKSNISKEEARRLKLANGGFEISTVSGSFLVQKALVYDISFTTRFQAEWPNAWRAFMRNPVIGSGFSTITLATDGDYLRALGEAGALGLITYLLCFAFLAFLLRATLPTITNNWARAYLLGIVGGMCGILFNATFIDIFEASKVAENMWLLLGIAAGSMLVYQKASLNYKQSLWSFVTSDVMTYGYMLLAIFIGFGRALGNFFVADDFTWLKWAATSTISDLGSYFTNAQNFFYRPFDKLLMFFMYTFFSFQPAGYHLVMLLLHFLTSIGVFILLRKLLNHKWFAFLGTLIFILLPMHGENLFWISVISTNLSSVFLIFAFLSFLTFREKKSIIWYILAFILFVGALLSYEMSVMFPLLLLVIDVFLVVPKNKIKTAFAYIPFLAMIPLYGVIRVLTHSAGQNGDYSYNLVHFIPNFIGNLFGYWGLFAFGDGFIPFYAALRGGLKQYALIALVIILIFVVIKIVFLLKYKSLITKWMKKETLRLILFAHAFIIVSLLPFLGLGNISERYGYFASIGFVLLVTMLFKTIYEGIGKKSEKKRILITLALFVLLIASYLMQINQKADEWAKAGKITQDTLGTFRIDYEFLPKGSHLYFANVPLRYGETWVFPLGPRDGLWFIYRDDTLKVDMYPTEEEAKKNATLNSSKETKYIFTYDDNYEVQEVK